MLKVDLSSSKIVESFARENTETSEIVNSCFLGQEELVPSLSALPRVFYANKTIAERLLELSRSQSALLAMRDIYIHFLACDVNMTHQKLTE